MYVTITLNSGLGVNLGPNFNLTADVGSVTPSTATKSELLAGKEVQVNASATQVTVTSTGACTNSVTINITGQTTTTTTASPAQFTVGYDSNDAFTSCANRTIDPRIVYAANGSTLSNGVVLYYDQQLTSPVILGYYSDGTNWYRVTGLGGTISSNGSCTTTSTTTTTAAPTSTTTSTTSTSTTTAAPTSTTTTTQAPATFSLRYSTISGGIACYETATTYYAENGSLLQDGTVIYTNGTLTTLAPAGWYSDGTNYWYVSPTCFEYDVTNSSGTAVNIEFRDCDNTTTFVTIAAGATENVCVQQFEELNGCTTVNKGVGICSITTNGILSSQTACPGTTTSTSTSTSTSTTSTSTSTSTSTTQPPTTSTSTSTSTSTTSTSTTSTTTSGPTTTTTLAGTTTTTTAAPTTTSTSTTTTTAAPTTTSTSTTSTSTTTAGPGLSVAQGTVTCTNDKGAFTSTASGGSGTYSWIAIDTTQANAIAAVNGSGGTRYAITGNTYNWSNIGNGTWYIAIKDSLDDTAFGTVVVACSTTTTTTTEPPTTTTSTSTTTEAPPEANTTTTTSTTSTSTSTTTTTTTAAPQCAYDGFTIVCDSTTTTTTEAPTTTTTTEAETTTTTTTSAATATLNWSFSEVTGGNGIYDLYINAVSVETRNSTASGTYTVSVGDVITVGCNADQCTGGGSTYTNIVVSGEITDAACQNNGSIPSYVSPGYTVVSGDIGTNLYMDLQVSCDGGCI